MRLCAKPLVHPTKPGKVTVAGHRSIEVPPGTLSSILKQAGLPDLPGCVALGFMPEETEDLIRRAVEQHIQALREDGDPIPEPSHVANMLAVA